MTASQRSDPPKKKKEKARAREKKRERDRDARKSRGGKADGDNLQSAAVAATRGCQRRQIGGERERGGRNEAMPAAWRFRSVLRLRWFWCSVKPRMLNASVMNVMNPSYEI